MLIEPRNQYIKQRGFEEKNLTQLNEEATSY